MKTKSRILPLGKTKKDQQVRRERLLGAHNHTVTLQGISYRIIVQSVGKLFLASAEALNGPKVIVNLLDSKSTLSLALRQRVEEKLYS